MGIAIRWKALGLLLFLIICVSIIVIALGVPQPWSAILTGCISGVLSYWSGPLWMDKE